MDNIIRDVKAFNEKFGLNALEPQTPEIIPDMGHLLMRANFMLEELVEYAEAAGLQLTVDEKGVYFCPATPFAMGVGFTGPNLEKALDGLIDLIYVAAGTAIFHGFARRPTQENTIISEAWRRVHNANMHKVKAGFGAPVSKRDPRFDIVKPEGWIAPTFTDLLPKSE